MTLSATPAGGAKFTGWSGACSGTGPCTLLLDYDQEVSATFAPAGASGTPGTPAVAPAGGSPNQGPANPAPKCTLKAAGNTVVLAAPKAKTGKAAKVTPGTLRLIASCDQVARVTLGGRVRILTGTGRRQRAKTVAVATVRIQSKPGHATALTIKLPAAALKALARRTRESASFTLSAVGAGGTTTRAIALRTIVAKTA